MKTKIRVVLLAAATAAVFICGACASRRATQNQIQFSTKPPCPDPLPQGWEAGRDCVVQPKR